MNPSEAPAVVTLNVIIEHLYLTLSIYNKFGLARSLRWSLVRATTLPHASVLTNAATDPHAAEYVEFPSVGGTAGITSGVTRARCGTFGASTL